MPLARRAIVVLSLVAVTAMFCGSLRAGETTVKSTTQESYEPAPPPILESGSKQRCTSSPIWCPDDYCPKCPPGICPPTYCGGCDCYDAKCPPCICPPGYCGSCDCYDAKCLPCVKIPWCFPSFYKCPPPHCCVKPGPKTGVQK